MGEMVIASDLPGETEGQFLDIPPSKTATAQRLNHLAKQTSYPAGPWSYTHGGC